METTVDALNFKKDVEETVVAVVALKAAILEVVAPEELEVEETAIPDTK